MKFFRIRIFFFFLAHIILAIMLLFFFSNPLIEHLYPKSSEEIEVYLENGATQQFQENPTEDMLSITTQNNGPPGTMAWEIQTRGAVNSSTPTIASQKLINQFKSTSNQTRFDIWSTIFAQTTWNSTKASDFTAEPQWKTEEHYILVSSSHQTTCPMSIKIKAPNVSWLHEKFLRDITIFMDSRHFTDKEWKRLGHFVPPYGWMELKYPVVKEVVSVLPLITDQQLLLAEKSGKIPHCVTCAVVGNGGILNASRMGKEIDSHDYVFRVNGAVTEGYEDDVGKRTSFYGFTAFTMLSSLILLKGNGFSTIPHEKETKYILFTEGQRDYEWLKALQQNKEIANNSLKQYRLRPRDDFGNSFDLKNLLVVHPDFSRYLKNRFLRSTILEGIHWRFYRPSTGALVLLTALHLCDTVNAYGFMTDDFKEYANHYYDKTKTELVFYINHDFILEKDLWARLDKENIIKLYKRNKGL
ncbi:alpha-N-acetylgalactosaminide alpha-2,6-sialyltransferase 1 [Anomaloglossus baeobatrachus]|uniref:alpha-N-acetylgalactosaminide alpha-2,6-sialyltransferase 1 n=1 Tax=Anomaloglossus baeobatrachus TaxID=238106 RepID=UPI003F50B493